MLRILLVRHAESKLNKEKKFQGSDKDSQLSPEGIEQVKKLAYHLQEFKPKKIYCSDLGRAVETARLLSSELNISIEKVENLRELKIGDWLQDEENILERWSQYYAQEKAKGISRENIRPPNGENSWDHARRVQSFLEEIKKQEGTIVIIAHSGTNKVLIGLLQNKDPDDFYNITQKNTCVNEITYDGKEWKILRINDISHLQGKVKQKEVS